MTLDLDVILAAHGAGDDSLVNAAIRALATQLERRLVGARVSAAFHKGEPSYASAVRRAARTPRVVVPLLTSDGYHFARLQRAVADADATGLTHVTQPLGTDPVFVNAFVERVAAQVDRLGVDRAAAGIVVVGHGTDRHPNSGVATTTVAAALLALGFDHVRVAFLDDEPTVEAVTRAIMPHEYLVVVPFLVGLGDHVTQDLPARIATGVPANRVAFVAPVAELPTLAELIERVIRNTLRSRVDAELQSQSAL
jgi:sirohydrochlorin cobaltochelatase